MARKLPEQRDGRELSVARRQLQRMRWVRTKAGSKCRRVQGDDQAATLIGASWSTC